MVKCNGSTVEVLLILQDLSIVEAGGILHVVVKYLDMQRNSDSEGSSLGYY